MSEPILETKNDAKCDCKGLFAPLIVGELLKTLTLGFMHILLLGILGILGGIRFKDLRLRS